MLSGQEGNTYRFHSLPFVLAIGGLHLSVITAVHSMQVGFASDDLIQSWQSVDVAKQLQPAWNSGH